MAQIHIQEAPLARFIFANTKMSLVWLIIRVYVGWQWLVAGWGKLHADVWLGAKQGAALTGFINGALEKTAGAHPDVQGWYAWFLREVVLPHVATWSHVVAWGEFLVGVALILGILTGIAAFFGLFMNFNFLLAGTVSVNPVLLALQFGLVLAWRVAGYVGVDKYLLPFFGVPWRVGKLFRR